jgi:geranylgeranyl diphosphate synthase type 3
MEELLLEPVSYYKKQKGKNIRKMLGDIFGKLMGISNDNLELIHKITNDVHNASLVIDDIEDNSELRRNEPCAHIKYGIPLSINAGYYSMFISLDEITKNFSQKTSNKIIEYLCLIHHGQGMDIYYTENKIIPDIKEYEKMMIYKTGYPFIMNLELLMDKSTNVIMAKNFEKIKNTLITFSLFFQIRDDYINITDPEYWKIKGFCQDFDEEKISYLVTLFKTMSDANVMEMMKDKSKEGKTKIILLFNSKGLFDIVYQQLLELKQQILNEMNLYSIFEQLPIKRVNINDIYFS